MKKTIVFTFLLLLAVIAVATLYFSDLSKDTRQNDRILSYIPASAGLVTSFRYDDSFVEIFRNYKLFDAVIGDEKATDLDQLEAFILRNTAFNHAANNQTFFVSFHSTPKSIDLLWLTALKSEIDEEQIYTSLSADTNNLTIERKLYGAEYVYEIRVHSINKIFYLFVTKGIAFGSFSKDLISQCLDTKTAKISDSFISEINSTNQKNSNSPVNLFFNHNTSSGFLNNIFINKSNGLLSLLKSLTGHTTLNMNFKGDALMFNGIGIPDTSADSYVNLFLKQKPVSNLIKNVLPLNTANFIAFGISNFTSFHSGLRQHFHKSNELKALKDQINRIFLGTGINLEKDVRSLWGKEFAIFQLATREKLAMIQVTDGSKLKFFLEPISTAASGDIRRFNNSNILYYYFGAPLKGYSRPFYVVVDNYLVVANTISTLHQFINSYDAGKTLSKEPDFRKFNQLVANQSNILFFNHTKNSKNVLKSAMTQHFSKAFDEDDLALKNFYGCSYQLSSEGDHFFINLYANYVSSESEKLESAWTFKLNGNLAIQPQVLSDNKNERIIIVQDNVNNVYAINNDGKKIWSSQIDSRILGKIQQLDDKSLLFNTSNRIYRIDPFGNSYAGFPVELAHRASFGGTVSGKDPDDLKLFIPCGDRIIGFTAAGQVISGWDKSVDGRILFDLKTATINITNYVIAGTEKGKFYFFNFNGNLIASVADPAKRTFNNPLSLDIVQNSAEESGIITSDSTGALRKIFFDGKTSSKNIGIWSEDHLFDLKNISGDAEPEYIFLDKNQLNVYRADSTLVFNYEFPYAISSRPVFFSSTSIFYKLAITSNEDNLLYLFNEDGSLHKGFPFEGGPYFYFGNLKTDGKTYLLCGGNENNLYAYRLNE